MYKEITQYLNTHYPGAKDRFFLRMQPEISAKLKIKYEDEKKVNPDLDYTDFLRDILALHVMPEIIENDLNKEFSQWITQEGQNHIELRFGTRIKKLQEIIEAATKSLEMTKELQNKFISLEVDYLNKVNKLLNKEKNK